MSVRVRFAPCPARPHDLAQARTALFNWLFARKRGGRFVLRIDETDRREASILADLRWLGLEWDEDVVRPGERGERYRGAAEELLRRGSAYLCFCSSDGLEAERPEQAAQATAAREGGRCRRLLRDEALRRRETGAPAAVRFAMPPDVLTMHDVVRGAVCFTAAGVGDFVIVRQDGSVTSDLAAVVDDAAMRITHVIRGEEHLASTPRQIALGRALGLHVPVFAHLPAIHDGDVRVAELREAGALPDAVVNQLALLGWSPPPGHDEVLPLERLTQLFALDRVAAAPSRFDPGRLAWLTRQHLRRSSPQRLAERLGVTRGDSFDPRIGRALDGLTARALEVVRREARNLLEAREMLALLVEPPDAEIDAEGRGMLAAVEEGLPGALGSEEEAQETLALAAKRAAVSRRAVLHVLRVALTGREQGLPLASIIWALGGEEVRRRIDRALETEAERA